MHPHNWVPWPQLWYQKLYTNKALFPLLKILQANCTLTYTWWCHCLASKTQYTSYSASNLYPLLFYFYFYKNVDRQKVPLFSSIMIDAYFFNTTNSFELNPALRRCYYDLFWHFILAFWTIIINFNLLLIMINNFDFFLKKIVLIFFTVSKLLI